MDGWTEDFELEARWMEQDHLDAHIEDLMNDPEFQEEYEEFLDRAIA